MAITKKAVKKATGFVNPYPATDKVTTKKSKVKPTGGRGGARSNSGPNNPYWGKGVETKTISIRVPTNRVEYCKTRIDTFIDSIKPQILKGV